MALVQRAPMTNHLKKSSKGIVRYVGAHMNMAKDWVKDSAKASFSSGRNIERKSVYAKNNS